MSEMKCIHRLWFLFALLLPIGTCVMYADNNPAENPKGAGSEMGYESMEILFEDQNLTDATKARIIADYKSVLDSLKPKGRRGARARIFRINDADMTITNYFLYTANYISYPGDYKDEIGRVGRSNNGDEVLFVSQTLSDGYKAAISLLDTHTDAFESLPDFLRLLNGMDKTTLTSVVQLVHYHGYGASEMTAEMKRAVKSDLDLRDQYNAQFIAEYSAYGFESGSIIDRFIDDERLYAKIFMLNKGTGERMQEAYAVYDQGRWKLLIPLM
jgi:hypothetical protein